MLVFYLKVVVVVVDGLEDRTLIKLAHKTPALRCGGLYYVQFVNENAINWI